MPINPRWFVLHLNPEPWVVPPASVGRRGGKLYVQFGRDEQLANYKEAVREALGEGHELIEGPVSLTFYFWRDVVTYMTPREQAQRKHDADSTNLQKATEDALQSVLFANDKDVHNVRSVIVEQGPNTDPCIIIRVDQWVGLNPDEIPSDVWALKEAGSNPVPTQRDDNAWPPTSKDVF